MRLTNAIALNERLRAELQREGAAYEVCFPCDDETIEGLRERASRELNCVLPDFYLDLLRLTDGFSSNGGTIYSSSDRQMRIWSGDPDEPKDGLERCVSGIVEETLGIRELNVAIGPVVVFGHSDLYYFLWDAKRDRYQIVTRGSLQITEEFGSLEDMLRQRLPPILTSLIRSVPNC